MKQLFDSALRFEEAPIVFPWELIDESLQFVPEERFPLKHLGALYFPLFKAIWQRAQNEIRVADKISFVGLSMHPFLNYGLRYLFAQQSGTAHVVVVNPSNTTRESHGQPSFDTTTPAGRVRLFLQNTGIRWQVPEFADPLRFDELDARSEFNNECCITSLKTFEQFIAEEMR